MQNLKNNKFELFQMEPQNTQSVLATVGDGCVIFDPWGHADDWGKILDERGLRWKKDIMRRGICTVVILGWSVGETICWNILDYQKSILMMFDPRHWN